MENTNLTNQIQNKIVKKLSKKLKRCAHVLEEETGIKSSSFPTKHLSLCNVGLINGLTEETVYECFSKIGTIENIVMIPGKSCCFISYQEEETAIKAFNMLNATLRLGKDNTLAYLLYTEDFPIISNNFNSDQPPGLYIIPNFITEDEERVLLALTDFSEENGICLKYRQIKHYGYQFIYEINNVNKNLPLEEKIPKECEFLWDRLKEKKPEFGGFVPDQLTVNYYKPGQGIAGHVDTHSAFEDPTFYHYPWDRRL